MPLSIDLLEARFDRTRSQQTVKEPSNKRMVATSDIQRAFPYLLVPDPRASLIR